MMNIDLMHTVSSLLLIIVYILRYQDNLNKRLVFLVIGSSTIFLLSSRVISTQPTPLYIAKSIILYISIDQLIFYIKIKMKKDKK